MIDPRPCTNLTEGIAEQAMHLAEEVGEVCKEIKLKHRIQAGEELMDVIVTANTMMHTLGYDDKGIEAMCNMVNEKNHGRGYWG